MRFLAFGSFLAVSLAAASAGAATVGDMAAKGACDTSGVVGLSAQLVDVQMCLSPGTFVKFTPHTNVTVTGTSVKPYLLATARDALWKASGSLNLQVNSAFRTIADQYVLYYSGACALAAKPGNSNHETGKAVDLENWSAAISAMTAAGCTHTYPSTDPVHFDCPGADDRADSIKAFQHLWNLNNPSDTIAEDGVYGPETESRLAKSPAGGFTNPGDCSKPSGPDYAAQFVDQSFPKAPTVLTMHAGEEVSGWIEMKNTGVKAWDSMTLLATTNPRDRMSPFWMKGWISADRPASAGAVAPGATHKFAFTLHAPDTPGDYDERFGMVEESKVWFSDPGQGGPADGLLDIKIKVVPADADAGTSDAGPLDDAGAASDAGSGDDGGMNLDAPDGSSGGCGCRTEGRGAQSGAFALSLFALFVTARRRRARRSTGT